MIELFVKYLGWESYREAVSYIMRISQTVTSSKIKKEGKKKIGFTVKEKHIAYGKKVKKKK